MLHSVASKQWLSSVYWVIYVQSSPLHAVELQSVSYPLVYIRLAKINFDPKKVYVVLFPYIEIDILIFVTNHIMSSV